MTDVQQPVTDDSIRVRQVSRYQFSWLAANGTTDGTFTLQLVLDQGAWEEVVSVSSEDAEVLQNMLRTEPVVRYDVGRRLLIFGNRFPGA